MNTEINNLSVEELLILYANIIERLIQMGVLRTRNNPVADYAEWLVAERLGLELAPPSAQGFDAYDVGGIRYQIKARRHSRDKSPNQLGVIRNLKHDLFDYLIAVFFDFDFTVTSAYKISKNAIPAYGKYSEHQNGYILRITADVISDKDTIDLLSTFR